MRNNCNKPCSFIEDFGITEHLKDAQKSCTSIKGIFNKKEKKETNVERPRVCNCILATSLER
jgi:hypothetical protein